jgi:pimeloyl-ACP methyl ester carboxylesterase
MVGECNTQIGEDHQRKQMKLFPGSELAIVKDLGHLMFADQPETSVEIVRNYPNETEEREPEN